MELVGRLWFATEDALSYSTKWAAKSNVALVAEWPQHGHPRNLTQAPCSSGKCLAAVYHVFHAKVRRDIETPSSFLCRLMTMNVSDSCSGVECEEDKMCVIRKGRPRCVCSSRCRVNKTVAKGPVCGTDGRSYKNICRLRKGACRRRSSTLTVDYNGLCQSMYAFP